MKRAGLFQAAWLLLAAAACASPPGRGASRPLTPPVAPLPPPPPAPVARPPLRIEVTSHDKIDNRLLVKLAFGAAFAQSKTLVYRPIHEITMEDVKAEDDNGPLALTVSGDQLQLPEGKRSTLRVQYALKFPESGAAGAPFAESIELHVSGEDLLALPPSAVPTVERFDVELDIKTGNVVNGGASSFGLGSSRKFKARFDELRDAFFIGGGVGTAEFHAGDGNDITAWIGHTAFDPRWIGAEVAATRAAVDFFVGRQHAVDGPPVAFLIVPTKRDKPPVVMMPRARGFLVSVDRRAVWNAQARILVGTALAQRYLGGFVSLGPRASDDGGLWSHGFARTVGREVVFDMGMIEGSDRAAEINRLLAAETFDPGDGWKGTVRGALMATALDARLRTKSSNLQSFLRDRLQEVSRTKKDEMTLEEFRSSVGADLFDAKEIPLPVDLLGRCWRLERKLLVPYERGFTTTSGEELSVTGVTPKSRAEAAGLRVNDEIQSLDYREGQADVPVTMRVRRARGDKGDSIVSLRFLPAGVAKMGRVFTRVAGIPDDRCY